VDVPEIYEPEGDDRAIQSVLNREDDDDEFVRINGNQADIEDIPPHIGATPQEAMPTSTPNRRQKNYRQAHPISVNT